MSAPTDAEVSTVSSSARKKQLKAKLARFTDREAFEPVENRIKHTCPNVGKAEHDKRKARREIALKRADAAIRFFLKPENLALLNARAINQDQPS